MLLSFFVFYFDINHTDGRRPASPKCNRTSPVVSPPASAKITTCCNCFGPLKFGQWDDAISNQMSEVYCRACDDDNYSDEGVELVPIPKDRLKDSPAILTNVTQRRRRQLRRASADSIVHQKRLYTNLNGSHTNELEISVVDPLLAQTTISDEEKNLSIEDCELGDDVATTSNDDSSCSKQLGLVQSNAINVNDRIRVRGKEELPVLSANTNIRSSDLSSNISTSIGKTNNLKKSNATKNHPLLLSPERESIVATERVATNTKNDRNIIFKQMHHMYATLPKAKKLNADQQLSSTANQPPFSIPMRITSDGTTIYYICDLPKNVIKGF